jgi:hypothetical protein
MKPSAAFKWMDTAKPCKIGTIPMVVHVHGRDNLAVGEHVRIRYLPGGRWERVLVTRVDPDGYFMADR